MTLDLDSSILFVLQFCVYGSILGIFIAIVAWFYVWHEDVRMILREHTKLLTSILRVLEEDTRGKK